MSVISVVAFLLSSGAARAQLQAGWQKLIPHTTPRDVQLDAAGGVWSLELTTGGVSNPIPVIRRHANTGTLAWTATLPQIPAFSYTTAFSVDRAGQFATMAYRTAQGSSITRVDGAGARMWQNPNWGISNIAYQYMVPDVPVDSNGNSFVISATTSSQSGFDFAVLSFAPDGTLRWARQIDGGGSVYDVPRDAALDGTGGLYVVGVWNAPSLTTPPQGQMAIARIDSAGNVTWTRSFSGAGGGGEALGVATDAAGNALVAGTSSSGTEAWLLKYDAQGTLLWSSSYSIGVGARFEDVAVDAAGSVYATGEQYLGTTPQGDILMEKRDANGNLSWRHVWDSGPGAEDYVRAVSVDDAGRVTVVGNRFTGAASGLVLRYERDGTPRARLEPALQIATVVKSSTTDANGRVLLTAQSTEGPLWIENAWTLELRDQSSAFCFGDGTSGTCPCGNTSAAGSASGCRNSTGVGAHLEDRGLASLSNDGLALTVQGTTTTGTCLFVQGSVAAAPIPFGDGYLCASGQLLRLYVQFASAGVAQAPAVGELGVSQRSAAEGGVLQAGDTRVYQVFYRDADLAFCPGPAGNLFNMSNAILLAWAP